MKKLIISLLATLSLGASTYAQENTSKGHVWKVSKNGKTNYLGGSVHALRKSDSPLPLAYDMALKNADKIIFETDIDVFKDPEIAQKMMLEGRIPDGKTLKDYISEDSYQLVDKVCKANAIPTEQIIMMKPMLGSMMISMNKLMKLGYDMTSGVDIILGQQAKKLGKSIGQLETPEQQLSFMLFFETDHVDELVQKQYKDFDKLEDYMNRIVTAFKSGNSEQMNTLFNFWKNDYPKLYDILLTQRNRNWMKKIPTIYEEGNASFIVVGAAHLYGEVGLINQLKKQGYQLEQL